MSRRESYGFDSWGKYYKQKADSEVTDLMLLTALGKIIEDLDVIKNKLKIGEEE